MNKIIYILMITTTLFTYGCFNERHIVKDEMHNILVDVVSDMLIGKTTLDRFDENLPDLRCIKNAKRIFMYSDILNAKDINDDRVNIYDVMNEFTNVTKNESGFDFRKSDILMQVTLDKGQKTMYIQYSFGSLGGHKMMFETYKINGRIKFKLIQHIAS